MRNLTFSIASILIFFIACRDSGGVGPSATAQYNIAYFSSEFSAVHILGIDGSNELALPQFIGHGTSVDWFPNGNTLVYADVVGDGFNDTASVSLYQLSSGAKQFLFSTLMLVVEQLSVSPNGSMVACRLYHYDNTGAELYVFDANGGNRRSLTPPNQFAVDCNWSPDGSHILFTLDSIICRINPDGSGFNQLSTGPGYKNNAAYSPDGTQIVYSLHYLDGSQAICVMNADGSNPHMITPLRYAFQGSPEWSPDGKLIAYIRDDSTHISRVFRMDALGANVQQLSSGSGVHSLPHWLPDMRIVYLSNDTQDLWVVDKDGIQAKQVTHTPAGMGGSYVYFALSKSLSH
jgi:Tol biopolymer transport system component